MFGISGNQGIDGFGQRLEGTAAGFIMMIFLGILVIGFIYEWQKGALEWE